MEIKRIKVISLLFWGGRKEKLTTMTTLMLLSFSKKRTKIICMEKFSIDSAWKSCPMKKYSVEI